MHGDHSVDPKGLPTAAIAATVQTSCVTPDIAAQLSYYHTHGLHGNLIQIAPHSSSMTTLGHNTNSLYTTAMDCRSMVQPTTQIFSPGHDVVVTSVSCLTPPSEPYCRSDLDSSGVSSIPEGKLNNYLYHIPLLFI